MGIANFNDWASNVKTTLVLTAATVTGNGTDTASTSVDTTGYDHTAFEVSVGNSADTLSGSLYLEVEVQESAESGANFTACADADVLNTVTAGNTGTVALINAPTEDTVVVTGQYTGTSQYARINLALTGNHASGTPVSVVAHQWGAKTSPVA